MNSLHEPAEPITSPLKAIRANCIDCMGGQRSLVRDCDLRGCSLWPYRTGKNPFRMNRNLTLPKRVSACACTWCQKRTGSAFGLSVYFDEGDIEILEGSLRKHRLTSDTGRTVESEFCEVCGTTVSFILELRPGLRGIAGGTFDQPTFWYDLETFIFARSKPQWLTIPDGLEVHDTAPYHPSVTGAG